jgi:hypothetical protein
LHHLIVRAAALADIPIAKLHRHVIDQLRQLKALQLSVAAMRRHQYLLTVHLRQA